MGFWYTLLGVATAVAQVVLNLSPVPDISRVHRRKRIGELAALPLVAMVVNCHFWLVYAYVTDSMFPLFTTQVFGQLAAIVYNAVYYRWSEPEKREELQKLYAWAFAVHFEVGAYLGYVGIVIDVWMFASPLGTLKHVMETKPAASIPINLSLMLFCVDVAIVFYMIYRPTGDEDVVQDLDHSEVSVVVASPSAKCAVSIQSPMYKILASPTTCNTE
ncbi:hypothetical protein PHYSODRAFT_324592 [Phytophthora sojae]|uniref:MtN3-like protein n=1 Tax=Phytophthora sojae (strain P6497) TaxID=1094619 RepID=G4Z005_PHYSP|nr:hypothetical protein PHYSODRAFT_324592 [Phytophthora sojae]EGZ23368.1 hypothetical protein PHYSODRAFT_324592 [Phytophthora sojae]|eukprot:XP_009518656.1 hypothetical protein PHYSODRAFT_324592 [Phytophthora sojae]